MYNITYIFLMGDRNEDDKVGKKKKFGESSVSYSMPKKSALVSNQYSGFGAFSEDNSQNPFHEFLEPHEIAARNQNRTTTYSGKASIDQDQHLTKKRVTLPPLSVKVMGEDTTKLYTLEQSKLLREERDELFYNLKAEIRRLKNNIQTRGNAAELQERRKEGNALLGTIFDKDPSADYEYTPEDFSKKSKLYLEDLIELNTEYIELCRELLKKDPSQSDRIQFEQNKLKANLHALIKILSESVENEPDSEEVDGWNESIAKYQEMLRELGEEGPGLKAGGGSATEEEDFGGRKKPKRRTIKRKSAKRSKTRKLKNKNKNKSKGKTSKKRSKRSRRR